MNAITKGFLKIKSTFRRNIKIQRVTIKYESIKNEFVNLSHQSIILYRVSFPLGVTHPQTSYRGTYIPSHYSATNAIHISVSSARRDSSMSIQYLPMFLMEYKLYIMEDASLLLYWSALARVVIGQHREQL